MKNAKYIVLGLLMSLALGVSARTFDAGERLYINMEAQSVKDAGGDLASGWYSTMNNYNYAYFYKGTGGAWSSQVKQYQGTVWYVEAPAGDWEYVILTRHNSANPDWSTKITQTGDIWFYYMDGSTKKMREQNYIQNFYYGSSKEEANWEYVAPAPSGNPASWSLTAEDEQLCTDAAGTSYVLQAKNYDYDNTYAHAWFKYSGGTWTRLDGDEWRKNEGEKVHTVTLGAVGSDVYYFLQCSRPSMCRLIRVRINQDCSEGAPGACKITSFAAVSSDANVTDQTCAVDGVVAFDDPKNAGDLKIWADDVDTVVIANAELETPQTFKLKGFDASSAKTYTLYAKFLNGTIECEASCSVTTKKPTAPVTTHDPSETVNGEALTRFTLEDITLTPTNQTSTYFQWTNSADEEVITTGDRNHTFTAPADQMDVEYVFLATNDPPAPEGNLISNGTFEDPALDGNLESNYDAWGRGNTNYYASHAGASGGYAITDDATTFWHEFQKVKAHEGTYFGLFDSKISDGTDQAAWIARSGAKNPKLKVDAGVSYLFSFWVANINAYYQMDNGAQLQFQISYNGGSSWSNLGSVINLGNFKDSRWHGMSSLVTPTVSSTNVVLRVININKSSINYGNDFALDDIRFEAVTSRTSNIAGFERFQVKYLECKITSATFVQRQPIGCGTTVADVDYTINFVNPRGDLYIYEGTTELAKILHADLTSATSHTGVLKNQPLDNKTHTLTVYFKDSKVQSPNPGAEFTYDAKAVPAMKIKTLTWMPLECNDIYATMKAVISYTNQNGTLTGDVDGYPANPATYFVEDNAEKDTTVIIPGIPADGKASPKVTIKFGGSHGCQADSTLTVAVPYSPKIDTLIISGVETTVPCGTKDYLASITIKTPYNALGKQIKLTYDDNGAKDTTITVIYPDNADAAGKTISFKLALHNMDNAAQTIYAAYTTDLSCPDSAKYTPPTMMTCKKFYDTICEGENYNGATRVPKNDFKINTPKAGLDTFTIAGLTDTLFLTVVEMPKLTIGTMDVTCDDESTIRIPFTGTTGLADTIDIAVDTNNYVGSIVGTDIVFKRASELVAGDYSAVVTVGTKGVPCVQTYPVNFTIALGGAMYSKWTDVLFVSNKDGKFVGYQWYENGVMMTGETMQRLYRPEGLPGSYYCRIMTTDGTTINTCEQSFDKVQPSRAAGQNATSQVVRKIRVSPHVYIIQTETDGVVETQKILTPYE